MGIHKTRYKNAGFTVIEVMLFLAVTGALLAGVFVAGGVGISNQRYADAVNSFQSIIQEEFINTTRVLNERSDGDPGSCGSSVRTGASDCIVIGRLVTVKSSGDVSRMNIIGAEPAAGTVGALDIIRSTSPRADYGSVQTGKMSWGSTLRGGESITLAIVRSPLTGESNISTYVWRGLVVEQGGTNLAAAFNRSDIIDNHNAVTLCIDPSGMAVAETKTVVLGKFASGPSSVEQRVAGSGECV